MSSVNIQPLRDGLIVKRDEQQQKTASGIVLPTAVQEAPLWGTVVKAGPGKKDYPMVVKVGQRVLFGQYAGTKFKIDGLEYLFLKEEDVLGVQEG